MVPEIAADESIWDHAIQIAHVDAQFKVLVETITQSRDSANACSERRRSSTESDA